MPDLPPHWALDAESTRYDNMMGRDYTTVCYRNQETGQTVRIFEVQRARASGWEFQVRASGRTGELGAAEDLDEAKDLARTHMTSPQPA